MHRSNIHPVGAEKFYDLEGFRIDNDYPVSDIAVPEILNAQTLAGWINECLNHYLVLKTEVTETRVLEARVTNCNFTNQGIYPHLTFTVDLLIQDNKGQIVFENQGLTSLNFAVDLYQEDGVLGIREMSCTVDKLKYWNLDSYPEAYLEYLRNLFKFFTATIYKNCGKYSLQQEFIPKRGESILLLGQAGTGKTTVVSKLNEEGVISDPDASTYSTQITGVNVEVYKGINFGPPYFQLDYLPAMLLEVITNTVFTNNAQLELANRLEARSKVTSLVRDVAFALSADSVHNGSLIQVLMGAMSYYCLLPFTDCNYRTEDVEVVEDYLRQLENPSAKTIQSILDFATTTGFKQLIELMLTSVGSPRVVIMTSVSEQVRNNVLSTVVSESERKRRYSAIKFEPWVKVWYRVFEICAHECWEDRFTILKYDWTQDKSAEALVVELKKYRSANNLQISAGSVISALENNPNVIYIIGNLSAEALDALFSELISKNLVNEFVKQVNFVLKSLQLPQIDYTQKIFPALDKDKYDRPLGNDLHLTLLRTLIKKLSSLHLPQEI